MKRSTTNFAVALGDHPIQAFLFLRKPYKMLEALLIKPAACLA